MTATPSTSPDPINDPLAAVLAGIGAWHCRRFAGHRLRLGRHGAVHDVELRPALGGVLLPSPACHTGYSSHNPDDLTPTDDGTTCVKCLTRGARRRADQLRTGSGQLALDLAV
ncbi:hypothetical protein F0L68_01320 [Solihabitans fulvus]|uniref:Uncharacterized protein n=1 Tax=Solihabitans fulvus TaxID=1892852 RepID=A0A5B2XWG9_9PSEU|nr:hypothetical protein [Solihabitans fulvus]KAA2267189.1 hypothetical protein F0L68_01320 [Solihabitans fulvus]